jgi:hypothetical protein
MGRELLCGLAFAAFIDATSASAAYVIKLKNGNEYVTTRYWHDGSQVLFDTYGGVFGIDKAFVNKIEKTDEIIRLARIADRDPIEKSSVESKESKEALPAKESDGPAIKKEKAPDDPVVGELNRLKDKAKEVDGMLTGEIRELLSQITAFKNKLAKDSKLFVEYGREFNDAHEIAAAVETALRSRTQ